MIQRWNVSVVKDSDSPCDCRADLVAASDGDFVLHREAHEAIRSWMRNSENYAKLLDNALRERDEAKRCLHVEMSMRKDAEVLPPETGTGPWRVVNGHDGAKAVRHDDGRFWFNAYFQASIAVDVAALLNRAESLTAALDGEREATRSVRIDIADIVRVVAEMPRAKADESIVRWTERLQAVTIAAARRAANEKEKSS